MISLLPNKCSNSRLAFKTLAKQFGNIAVWRWQLVLKVTKKKKKLEINLACRPIETNDGSQFLRKLF